MPPSAASSGSANRRRSRSSPRSNSRRASSPRTKNANVIRPLFTHSRSGSDTPAPPRLIDSIVSHKSSYEDAWTFTQTRAASAAPSSTAAPPVSVRRNSCSGVRRLRAHAVRPEKADAQAFRRSSVEARGSPFRGEHFVARGLAPAADVSADPAVLVVGGVPVALLGAGGARRRASLDHRSNEADVGTALPGRDARGRVADVRAVESDADNAGQLRQVALAQAGVGAGGAAGTAIETLLGTPKERLAKIASRQGVQLHDLAEGHLPERACDLAIRGIAGCKGIAAVPGSACRRWNVQVEGRWKRRQLPYATIAPVQPSPSKADKMVALEQRPAESSPAVSSEDVSKPCSGAT